MSLAAPRLILGGSRPVTASLAFAKEAGCLLGVDHNTLVDSSKAHAKGDIIW